MFIDINVSEKDISLTSKKRKLLGFQLID